MVHSEGALKQNAIEELTSIIKLVEKIKKKIKSSASLKSHERKIFYDKLEELRTLKAGCCSEDALTSLTACQGLVSLVHSNCMSLQDAFSFFQSCYYSGSVPRGQSAAVLSLLFLDLKAQLSEKNVYENPIKSTKSHPLCRILRQDPNSWKDLINQMTSVINHHDERIRENALKLLKPIFSFILIEYSSSLSETCLHHTWKLMAERAIVEDKNMIFDFLSSTLFQSRTRNRVEICYDVIVTCQLSESDEDLKSALTLILASFISDVMTHGYDPCSILSQLKVLLGSSVVSNSVILIILSQSISICPASFLASLLNFCEWLIGKGQCSIESKWMCAIACLPWLNNCVSQSLMNVHRSIMAIISELATDVVVPSQANLLIKNPYLPKIINFNKNIALAIHTARLCDNLRDKDAMFVVEWLNRIPNDSIVDIHLLVEAVMSCRKEPSIRMSALKTLQKAPVFCASQNLMFFTYQLAKEKEPEIQLELLKSIISTAIDKKNIPHIMQTIKTMQNSGQPVLQILAVDLTLQLWLRNELCYPFLISTLTENRAPFPDKECENKMNIACAAVMYQICLKKPEKHGRELVQPIQNLLIKCQGPDGAIASSLIMKSLAALIRAKVLSPSSTWVKLKPLLKNMHPSVCVSMCELVGTAIQQNCTDEVNHSMSSWLWSLVTSSETEYVVVDAALSALKEYTVETMKFTSIPDIYKINITLPSDKVPSGNLVDAVPGDCWVKFLESVRSDARQSACKLIASWLSDELNRYRGVYDATLVDPENYNKLPYYSVCRSLVSYLRRTSAEFTDEKDLDTKKLVLQILNTKRSKLLPPVNWKFISSYLGNPAVEEDALTLMAKESKGSMSAKKLIKNYLSAEPLPHKFMYEHLPDLVDFCGDLESCIRQTLPGCISEDQEKALHYLKCLKRALEDPSIDEENKKFLYKFIKEFYEEISVQDPVFNCILDCCVELPEQDVTIMTRYFGLLKAYKLDYKMSLAGKSSPFTWLDECIDLYIQHQSDIVMESPLSDVKEVLIKFYEHEGACTWVMENLEKMVKFIDLYAEIDGLNFFCRVFISAVIHVSKLSVLSAHLTENEEQFYFSVGMKMLIDENCESTYNNNEILYQLGVLAKNDRLDASLKSIIDSGIQAAFVGSRMNDT